ncbi:MAG: ZIP family metal transporter [Planctomycetia bacterium]|nr:ZIP family metal transporter [Planctomycetia bacterium]
METWLLTIFTVGMTTVVGAILGFFLRQIPHRFNDAILGMAAGMMLAAAIVGLILPALEQETSWTVIQVILGVFCGATIISMIDQLTPHLHQLAGIDMNHHGEIPDDMSSRSDSYSESHAGREAHGLDMKGVDRVLLFVTALAIHKFPEGLAVGVSFGTENLGDTLTVAGSIALQNIPEGMVIIVPLLAVGVSMSRTFFISLVIGLIEILGAAVGYSLISFTNGILPFALSFAGGTMLYVISDEMIPETHSHGYEKMATFALLAGFMFVLITSHIFGA